MEFFLDVTFGFAFFYPLLMAYIWMTGAIMYYRRFESKQPTYNQPPKLSIYPMVSILVPCFNESKHARSTFEALVELDYPNYEVIAVNDGSSDDTGSCLEDLARDMPRMRVVHLATNQGKAKALKSAAMAAKGEFFVCIDCDAILDHYAVTWIMTQFINNPRVGAVTGNPRIRNRATFLGRIQVGEFSAIIGLLKRAQRVYGRVFTISGVIGGFRRTALHRVGYWSSDTQTEDIDISWNMQLSYLDVRFEPRALCWILMPETIRGLYKQRLRWAIGGGQVIKKYFGRLCAWNSRRMWGVFAEYCLSILWSYSMLIVLLAWVYETAEHLYRGNIHDLNLSLAPQWQGALLGITCLLQFAISLYIDRRYDHKLFHVYLSVIWFPIFYWVLNWVVAFMGFPKAMLRRRTANGGKWVTLDRGVST
ncbi:MAG: poly-beta-1,6 N-acetyl-D-glucosamine synthase [Planctomycetota bacterium]|nr:poly-beta-1,6 N-acetyl-D-glucosamine synthase [Planctomycetota bacterium]